MSLSRMSSCFYSLIRSFMSNPGTFTSEEFGGVLKFGTGWTVAEKRKPRATRKRFERKKAAVSDNSKKLDKVHGTAAKDRKRADESDERAAAEKRRLTEKRKEQPVWLSN
ncbi:hypothetical protein C8J56DRAFT_1027260 [Mycena floridula]|nr:hypothetical protein C8J56DRAFT_1027260 [Mycena floridula]